MNTLQCGNLQVAEERVPPGEEQAIMAIMNLQTAIMRVKGPDRRGQHPKAHGCVEATFTVLPNIPLELKVGIFSEPKVFKALVRFSNGKSDDDRHPDVHGMAIKVLEATGPRAVPNDGLDEQDFIMIDSETFFASDAESLLGFMKASVAAERSQSPAPIQDFAKSSEHNAKTVAAAQKLPKGGLASPLAIPY